MKRAMNLHKKLKKKYPQNIQMRRMIVGIRRKENENNTIRIMNENTKIMSILKALKIMWKGVRTLKGKEETNITEEEMKWKKNNLRDPDTKQIES